MKGTDVIHRPALHMDLKLPGFYFDLLCVLCLLHTYEKSVEAQFLQCHEVSPGPYRPH